MTRTREENAADLAHETRLPPDPDCKNPERAYWAHAALIAFRNVCKGDMEDALGDLLCDLHHWCDRNNTDFLAALNRGHGHYRAETNEQDSNLPGQYLRPEKLPTLGVVIEGGSLSAVIADDPEAACDLLAGVVVIDYDTGDAEETYNIVQSNGGSAEAIVGDVSIETPDIDFTGLLSEIDAREEADAAAVLAQTDTDRIVFTSAGFRGEC